MLKTLLLTRTPYICGEKASENQNIMIFFNNFNSDLHSGTWVTLK